MRKIVMLFYRGWILAPLLSFPLTSYAYVSCTLSTPSLSLSLGNFTISSTTANNTKILNQSVTTSVIQCTTVDHGPGGKVTMWLNPYNTSLPSYLEMGITYNGIDYPIKTGTKVITTEVVPDAGIKYSFSLSYSVYIKKIADIPATVSTLTIPIFKIIRLDSDSGENYLYGKNYVEVSGSTITVTHPTCELRATDKNRSVTLPSVHNIDFPSSGSRKGKTNFDILVSNCSTSLKTASFTFSGTRDTKNAALFANTGTAQGIAIRLSTTSDNQTIGANNLNNVRNVTIASQQATLPLSVEYQSTGVVTGGTVRSSVNFTVNYQ